MRARKTLILALAASLLALVALAGCGASDNETEVNEGEPLELGDLHFNVQITRYLNPFSPEDSQYLAGAPELKKGEQYLGVFMEIQNEGDDEVPVPSPFRIVDTRGNVYEQAKGLDNPFALVPGTPVPSDGQVPGIETAAANGPIEGSLILFLLPEGANENRPLQLEVPNGGDEPGKVELDL
jgi:hypothetical protein